MILEKMVSIPLEIITKKYDLAEVAENFPDRYVYTCREMTIVTVKIGSMYDSAYYYDGDDSDMDRWIIEETINLIALFLEKQKKEGNI